MTHLIQLAKDFSRFPGGRFKTTDHHPNEHSGEEFRDDFLFPLVKDREDMVVTVDLNGVFTLAPSFLDECFGVLMERMGMTKFDRQIKIHLTDDADAAAELQDIRARRSRKMAK